jgi:hypothetical protein
MASKTTPTQRRDQTKVVLLKRCYSEKQCEQDNGAGHFAGH